MSMTQDRKKPPGFNEEIFRQGLEDDVEVAPIPAAKQSDPDRPVDVVAADVPAETGTASGDRHKSPDKQAKVGTDTHTDQPPSPETGSDRFSWLAMIVIALSIIGFSVSNWVTNNRIEALNEKVAALESRLEQSVPGNSSVDSDSDSIAEWLQSMAGEISSGDETSVAGDTVPVELPPAKEDADLNVVAALPEKELPPGPQASKDITVPPAVVSPELKLVGRPPAATGDIHTLAGSVQKYVLAPVGNGREAPDTGSRIVARLKKGVTVTALFRQGDWYQVQLDDGAKAWAHQSIFGRPPANLPADEGYQSKAGKEGKANASEQIPETRAVTGLMAAGKDIKPKALAEVRDRPSSIEPKLNTPEAQSVRPPPSPAASDTTASIDKGTGWAVYLTSLKSEEAADRELALLQGQGIQADKHVAIVRGEEYYQLRTGRFAKTEEALAYMRQVAARIGYKNAWIARR